MIILHIESAYASFRQSYARSLGETYEFVPPSTVYGMLLSLVGEYDRRRHLGVKLAFAYKSIPPVSKSLRQASPLKYGLTDSETGPGAFMDTFETLSDIDFYCWVNSESEHENVQPTSTVPKEERTNSKSKPRNAESKVLNSASEQLNSASEQLNSDHRPILTSHHQHLKPHEPAAYETLETRITAALLHPENSTRTGMLSLGLSDDLIDELRLVTNVQDELAYTLKPSPLGYYELPVWVDHVGAKGTAWTRFEIENSPSRIADGPGTPTWPFVSIEIPVS